MKTALGLLSATAMLATATAYGQDAATDPAMAADALTKIVLADADSAKHVLQTHRAQAWRHHPREGWRALVPSPVTAPLK